MAASGDRSRRRHRRVTLRVAACYAAAGRPPVDATATTLGAGGVFIRSDHPLPPGTPVRVRLRLEQGDHDLVGRVVWSNDASVVGVPASGRGMGIAFSDPAAQSRLADALAELDA